MIHSTVRSGHHGMHVIWETSRASLTAFLHDMHGVLGWGTGTHGSHPHLRVGTERSFLPQYQEIHSDMSGVSGDTI